VMLGLTFYVWSRPVDGGLDEVAVRETLKCCLVACLASIVFNVAVGIAINVPRLSNAVPCTVIELVGVFTPTMDCFLVFMVDIWYMTKFLGHDPEHVWSPCQHRFSDTRPLLALSALVLGAHVMLPIRWVMFIPLQVVPLVAYAWCAFVLGSPDGITAWSSFLLFVAIIVIGSLGRRIIEGQQRTMFGQLICERSLRVQTEFQLSQLEDLAQEPRGQLQDEEGCPSNYESRPETTDSARVFQECSNEEVMRLGKQEQWYIDRSELKILPMVLGHGSFGCVVAGTFHSSKVAVKQALVPKTDEKEHTLGPLFNEVRILRRLRHPSIVLFFGACVDDTSNSLLLVLERVQGIPLKAAVLEGFPPKRELGPEDRLRALLDVSRALCYLHSRQPRIVHGDLKPGNTFVQTVPGTPGIMGAKLLDFGLSRVLTRHAKPLGGSRAWMAPEVALGLSLPQPASDIFSFGRLVFFTVTGSNPCERTNMEALLGSFRKGRTPPLPWPQGASALAVACKGLVGMTSVYKEDHRPMASQVQQQLEGVEVTVLGGGSAPQQLLEAAVQGEEAQGEGQSTHRQEEDMPQHSVLALPAFAATPTITTTSLVVAAVRRMNLEVPTGTDACCPLHAGVRSLQDVLVEMARMPCICSLFDTVRAQCPNCQTLLHVGMDDTMGSLEDASQEGSGSQPGGGETDLRCPTCDAVVSVPDKLSL